MNSGPKKSYHSDVHIYEEENKLVQVFGHTDVLHSQPFEGFYLSISPLNYDISSVINLYIVDLSKLSDIDDYAKLDGSMAHFMREVSDDGFTPAIVIILADNINSSIFHETNKILVEKSIAKYQETLNSTKTFTLVDSTTYINDIKTIIHNNHNPKQLELLRRYINDSNSIPYEYILYIMQGHGTTVSSFLLCSWILLPVATLLSSIFIFLMFYIWPSIILFYPFLIVTVIPMFLFASMIIFCFSSSDLLNDWFYIKNVIHTIDNDKKLKLLPDRSFYKLANFFNIPSVITEDFHVANGTVYLLSEKFPNLIAPPDSGIYIKCNYHVKNTLFIDEIHTIHTYQYAQS